MTTFHVLARREPVAVKQYDVGVGRAHNHIDAANHVLGFVGRGNIEVELGTIGVGEATPVIRITAVYLDPPDWPLGGEGEKLVGCLPAGAKKAHGLGIFTHQVAEPDATRRRSPERHQAGRSERLLVDLTNQDSEQFAGTRIVEHMDRRTAIGISLIGFLLKDELSACLGTNDAEPVYAARKVAHPHARRRVDPPPRRIDHGKFGRLAIALLNGVNRLAHAHQPLQFVRSQDQDAHRLMPRTWIRSLLDSGINGPACYRCQWNGGKLLEGSNGIRRYGARRFLSVVECREQPSGIDRAR